MSVESIKKPLRHLRARWQRNQAHRFAQTSLGGARNHVGVVAFNALPVNASWGGGNQWLRQMVRHLGYCGYRVVFDLAREDIDCIVILHSSDRQGGTFGINQIQAYKRRFPRVKVLHRINENDARKGTGFMDADIKAMNAVADQTVFISRWLQDHHKEKGLTPPGAQVIWNGADSRYFNPVGSETWKGPSENLILVTHHWAGHWNKGFKVYEALDKAIADGTLKGVELWVIGGWPEEIQWQKVKTFGPCQDLPLAQLLKKAHVYITASQAEPGGMHFIEGLQCGLPLLYDVSGGGIVEVAAKASGIAFAGDPLQAIATMKKEYGRLRDEVLKLRLSGERMALQYGEAIKYLVTRARDS